MAGRPVRRAREAAKQNPLVGFINDVEFNSREAEEPKAVMLHPKYGERLAHSYAKVIPNIIVYVGDKKTSEELQHLAAANDAVVLCVTVRRRHPNAEPFYVQELEKKRSPFRETPWTPFTLLHRLGDELGNAAFLKKMQEASDKARDRFYKESGGELSTPIEQIRGMIVYARKDWDDFEEILYKGVNTQAGRLGLLISYDQAASDLFAKYLLTGRFDYNPPPTDNPIVADFYATMKLLYAEAIGTMLSYLVPGRVIKL
jgi:hypothetical protein